MSYASARPISKAPHVTAHLSADRWPRGVSTWNLFVDGLWILFIAGATSAGYGLGLGQVERYLWFAADLAVAVSLLVFSAQFIRFARRNMILVAWPLLALSSTAWSFAPFMSIYHGAQLLMTVMVGFLLCIYARLERILQLVFVALLLTAVFSLINVLARPSQSIGWFGEWVGVFSHKNVLGHMMAILLLTGICLFLQGWRPVITLGGMALALGLLLLSRSGAATVALLVATCPLPLLLAVRRGALASAMTVGVLGAVGALLLLSFEIADVGVIESFLDALGKDATLTGRTMLWDFGVDAYYSRPWLGFGYKGYWNSDDTDAALLQYVLGQKLWFFHNNFIEVAVAFGFLGPLVFGAGLCVALASSFKRAAVSADYATLWPALIVTYVIILALAENPLFENHSFHQLLFIAAVASARRHGEGA